jgi:hypothetical protein
MSDYLDGQPRNQDVGWGAKSLPTLVSLDEKLDEILKLLKHIVEKHPDIYRMDT